jgi:hypothetical protein
MPRTVAIVIFPGFQLLDAAGPIAAFELAGREPRAPYRIPRHCRDGGPVASSSGIMLTAEALPVPSGIDTLLVVGAGGRARPTLILDCWHGALRRPGGAAGGQCVHRCLRARCRRPARRPARHDALALCRNAGAAIPDDRGRARPHLCARRQYLDRGRDHRRHRSRAGADRRGSRRVAGQADRPMARRVPPPPGRPVAILGAAAARLAGRAFRPAARLAGRASGSTRRCRSSGWRRKQR